LRLGCAIFSELNPGRDRLPAGALPFVLGYPFLVGLISITAEPNLFLENQWADNDNSNENILP
jgi:hypothetical protein